MAIVAVRLARTGRSGNADEKFNREYEAVYQVIVDDPWDGPFVVGNAPGIPLRFASYVLGNDVDLAALCVSAVPKQTADWQVWEVTVKWKTDTNEDQNEEDPLDRPIKRSTVYSEYQKPVQKDVHGAPIVTPAGQLIGGVEVDDTRTTHVFVRNEAEVNDELCDSYNDKLNDDDFMGKPPGTCKIKIRYGELQFEAGVEFYEATYEASYRAEGWDREFAARGTLCLDAPNGKLVKPVDKFMQPMDGEVNLNLDGTQRDAGLPLLYMPPTQLYDRVPFADLALEE